MGMANRFPLVRPLSVSKGSTFEMGSKVLFGVDVKVCSCFWREQVQVISLKESNKLDYHLDFTFF